MLPEMARFGMSVCHSPGNRGHPGMCTMFHLGESYSLYYLASSIQSLQHADHPPVPQYILAGDNKF